MLRSYIIVPRETKKMKFSRKHCRKYSLLFFEIFIVKNHHFSYVSRETYSLIGTSCSFQYRFYSKTVTENILISFQRVITSKAMLPTKIACPSTAPPIHFFRQKKICFDESGRCATIANESGSSFVENLWTSFIKGAVSSFGRALPWHGRGEEFESPTVHVLSFFCPHSSTDRTVPS